MKKFNNIVFALVVLLVLSIGFSMAASVLENTQLASVADNVLYYGNCTGWFDGESNIPRYCSYTETSANFLHRAIAIITYNGDPLDSLTAIADSSSYSSSATAYRTPTYGSEASNCGHLHSYAMG